MTEIKRNNELKKVVERSRINDRLHRRLFERHAANAFGIHRSQHMTLMYISRNPNASQKQIANEFKISAAAVAVTLKKLEGLGLILRSTADGDCRQNNITITDKGKAVIDETKTLFSAIDYLMYDGMTDDQIALLSSCCEKMYENLLKAEQFTTEQLKGVNNEKLV